MAGGKRGGFSVGCEKMNCPAGSKKLAWATPRCAASQGASFHRGFRRLRTVTYFAHGGKVGKTPPGTAPDEHFVLIVAFPRAPFTWVTPWAVQKISGAQN